MITKNEISSLNLSPTKKDFVQIWNELMEVASKITERWDPTSTNESDPGIVLLKVLTGIADKLNYNIDKNILEAYMPTAAQMESMRKLCELVGYDIKYYQSAETKVRISYTGNTADTEDNEEKLPKAGLALPKFTTITNADKDVTFVTTNTIPLLITNATPWVEVSCIEGQISQCESLNENNLITLSQLDDNNRYYLPETQIAENGVFVYNAVTGINNDNAMLSDGAAWSRVSNLNTQPSESPVFKFGYDSFEGRPYIAFPSDIGNLIGDGLFIYFIRTSGLSGNISPRTLESIEIPSDSEWKNYSAEQFEVVNIDATTNGANIESISSAYNSFKKTVGTFDTLVTCRDYMNKLYSLMENNTPCVSNILVTDIRSDINKAITLCSCNESGILYKETPLTKTIPAVSSISVSDEEAGEKGDNIYKLIVNGHPGQTIEEPLLDHFELVLYPFKTFTQVSSGTKDLVLPYNKSFTFTDQRINNGEFEAALADIKTCAHRFVPPEDGDVVAINNYLRLDALIATSTKVSEVEANSILQNVKVALVNEFNLRNLDFGEEIPFDSILSVIENADSRIKVVSLQEPTLLTTYSVKNASSSGETSKEYGIVSTIDGAKVSGVLYGDDNKTVKGETAKDIYNKLVLRNILAGRASLFDYDETFVSNNSEKPYTITKNVKIDEIQKEELKNSIKQALSKAPTGESVLDDVQGENGGTLTALVDGDTKEVYETYTPKELPSIIDNITRIEATCTLEGTKDNDDGLIKFNDITLDKNEVIKFRAPNLITTKTYPAYIYYRFERATKTSGVEEKSEDGRNASVVQLTTFINDIGPTTFFTGLWEANRDNLMPFNASKPDPNNPKIDQSELLPGIFNSAIAGYIEGAFKQDTEGNYVQHAVNDPSKLVDNNGHLVDSSSQLVVDNKGNPISLPVDDDGKPIRYYFDGQAQEYKQGENGTGDYIKTTQESYALDINGEYVKTDEGMKAREVEVDYAENTLYKKYDTGSYFKVTYIYEASNKTFCLDRSAVDNFSILADTVGAKAFTLYYYPLSTSTMYNWDKYILDNSANWKNTKYKVVKSSDGTLFWRLSQTSSFPKGKLITGAGQKLFAQTEEYLKNNHVGNITYLCTDLGEDPVFYSVAKDSDVELRSGDKLYIHYTPSSTNEDGETVTAEPLSIVYDGDDEEPVIIKPSFELIPSDDINKQGTSWKKTDVDFGSYGKKNLLSLGANEQIEVRGVNKVVLNAPARFYRNFEAKELDGNINKIESYELKDGEYIFYTNQNTQEAAYYGSGSVITLDKGAYIPKATDQVEVSQILEQGLHIVPWSDYVLLSPSKKITVTEYQYRTLTEGDKLNTLALDSDKDHIGSEWVKCSDKAPIIYTVSSDENSTQLNKIDLKDPNSAETSRIGWEVCSLLELSTAPGYSQTLRATPSKKNKIKIYTATGVDEKAITIEPQETDVPASGTTAYEPISIKLSTIAQVASGTFKKPENDEDSDDEEDISIQMKVFKEEAPTIIDLEGLNDTITPISNNTSLPTDIYSANVNNYWTKIDISSSLTINNTTKALKLNFMIPDPDDMFGVFSFYLDVPEDRLDPNSKQGIPKAGVDDQSGSRVFIEVPKEYGDAISIFNYHKEIEDKDSGITQDYYWWTEGIAPAAPNRPARLYLRAGLNCIKVAKSCSLLIKAEKEAVGNLLYDNMRLVRGVETNGVNLALLNPDATFNDGSEKSDDERALIAQKILDKLSELDKNHDFYYNVPVENSLAMEFNKNINSFSNPYTLYDINNINNNFVISKLDVKYLDTGLKIAKSSKY